MKKSTRVFALVMTLMLAFSAFAQVESHKHALVKWRYVGLGNHWAPCTTKSCSYSRLKPCEELSVTVNGHTLTACPICGHSETVSGTRAISCKCLVYNYDSSPMGDIWAIVYENPFGDDEPDISYAVSTVFNYYGVTEAYDGDALITVVIPDLENFSVYTAENGELKPIVYEYSKQQGTLKYRTSGTGNWVFIKRI